MANDRLIQAYKRPAFHCKGDQIYGAVAIVNVQAEAGF